MARTNLTKEIVTVASPLEWGRLASRDGQIDYLQAGIVEPSIMKNSRARGRGTAEVFQTQTLDLQIPLRIPMTISDTKR